MSYSSMILLQIGCEFLDACSGENNGVAAQVLTAGGGASPRYRARGVGAHATRSGFAPVSPEACYTRTCYHGAKSLLRLGLSNFLVGSK